MCYEKKMTIPATILPEIAELYRIENAAAEVRYKRQLELIKTCPHPEVLEEQAGEFSNRVCVDCGAWEYHSHPESNRWGYKTLPKGRGRSIEPWDSKKLNGHLMIRIGEGKN